VSQQIIKNNYLNTISSIYVNFNVQILCVNLVNFNSRVATLEETPRKVRQDVFLAELPETTLILLHSECSRMHHAHMHNDLL